MLKTHDIREDDGSQLRVLCVRQMDSRERQDRGEQVRLHVSKSFGLPCAVRPLTTRLHVDTEQGIELSSYRNLWNTVPVSPRMLLSGRRICRDRFVIDCARGIAIESTRPEAFKNPTVTKFLLTLCSRQSRFSSVLYHSRAQPGAESQLDSGTHLDDLLSGTLSCRTISAPV